MQPKTVSSGSKPVWYYIRQSLSGENLDVTTGSIRKAIFLLAIPMILEMCMESVFAVVDIFFVGKLGPHAAATVGLTESFLAIVYSLAIGLSMAATALVARRVGEKNPEDAAKAAAQTGLVAIGCSLLVTVTGILFSRDLLRLMGADQQILTQGVSYTRIMLCGNLVIMLLFLINGIFRGAGNAAIAMRSLWLANLCNIILCPLLIHFFGLPGAAMATTIGRGIGVIYQLTRLFRGKSLIHFLPQHFRPDAALLRSIFNIASTATLQFIVASASWIVMARIISGFGSDAMAGYTIAIRLLIFFIMPAWGLSNAAATLVGQNLGAQQPERAERSVWMTAKYNALFMASVSLLFICFAGFFVRLISTEPAVVDTAVSALHIISLGYICYGVGMVMINAFNGSGDSRTPTWINLFWFWIFQIPLAYALAHPLGFGAKGVYIAIVTAETCIAVTSVILFRKGKWKLVKI